MAKKVRKKADPVRLRNKLVDRAIKRIKIIEKVCGKSVTRSACQKYVTRERETIRLEKEIKQRELELEKLKGQKKLEVKS